MQPHDPASGVRPRPLAPGYAVAPQIRAQDVAALAAMGFRTLICNRPDDENPPGQQAAAIRAAAEAAGLAFVENPLAPGGLSPGIIARQRETIDGAVQGATGPVLAYCASGNRSSVLWALAMAGRQPVEELIAAAARHGYQLAPLRPLIEAQAGEVAANGAVENG